MVEYLIIVCLVAVGTIGIIRVVGQNVSVQYANIAKALGSGDDHQLEAAKIERQMYKKRDLGDFLQGSTSGKKNSKGNE